MLGANKYDLKGPAYEVALPCGVNKGRTWFGMVAAVSFNWRARTYQLRRNHNVENDSYALFDSIRIPELKVIAICSGCLRYVRTESPRA